MLKWHVFNLFKMKHCLDYLISSMLVLTMCVLTLYLGGGCGSVPLEVLIENSVTVLLVQTEVGRYQCIMTAECSIGACNASMIQLVTASIKEGTNHSCRGIKSLL